MKLRRILLVVLVDSFLDALIAVLIVSMWIYFSKRSEPVKDTETLDHLHQLVNDYRSHDLDYQGARTLLTQLVTELRKRNEGLQNENEWLRSIRLPDEDTAE